MSRKKSESVGGLSTGIDNTRLDVVVTEQDDGPVVTLQLSTWRDASGWQVQKKIPLAAKQLSQLQRLLSQARNVISDGHKGAGNQAQVIPIGARQTAPSSVTVPQPGRRTKKAAR
ncbi:MAG TPA: hypothetical protein VFD58_09675 [Blastocatellia bacterium]|nr:hypothetical protein [Blastocatellia bacterium]